jgi:hypothetical protein
MARRADPERIFQARCDAIRNVLTGSEMRLEIAERWCDAWVLEATRRGSPRDGAYWRLGSEWIAGERGLDDRAGEARRPPPRDGFM